MAGKKKLTDAERFMSHVVKDADGGCWLWSAYKMPSGYGFFKTPRTELAHRAAFRLLVGPLTPGLEVMHKCDTPSCVNPEHLLQGTRTENMRDAKAKGRNARGEGHGRAVLSESMVSDIRSSPGFQREIAATHGISQSQVSRIRRGEHWAQSA